MDAIQLQDTADESYHEVKFWPVTTSRRKLKKSYPRYIVHQSLKTIKPYYNEMHFQLLLFDGAV